MRPVGADKSMMGRYISTKAVSTISREHLTHAHKFPYGRNTCNYGVV